MERAGGGKENLSRRRKSTVAAAAATAATAQAQATSSENKTSSSLKKRHAGIMTQQPQAMEGVTELGRDGKWKLSRLFFFFGFCTEFLACRYCGTKYIKAICVKRREY